MNWDALLAPVIIAAVPILVAFFKKLVPTTYRDELTLIYPVLATALGPALDYGLTFISSHQTGKYALLYGMAGVALREILDQIKKTTQKNGGAAVKKAMLIPLVLIPMLGGCGYMLKGAGEYPGYIECKGKGSITGTGQTSLSAGVGGAGQNTFTLVVDCGDGVVFQQGATPPTSAPAPAK